MTEQVGRVLGGRYRLLAPIGRGASAQVFVADDVRLDRQVAVKVLHDALADDQVFLRRFQAEAQAAAALNHPHVMAVYDWGHDTDVPWIVMEYLGGGSLRGLLDAGHRLTPSQALVVGLQAARGLDYAHRRGFVHRDVKPANLLFGDEGRLRIADFGLARALAEAAWTEPAGAVVGTARYASPEQARGESLDGKSDVYSLALVIIEAVTGSVPFAADTTIGTLMARVNQPLRVPDELVALRQPLEWAGVPDPAKRPDAAEFGAALMAAAVDFDRPPALTLAGAHVDGDALTHLFDPTEQGGLPPIVPPPEVAGAGVGVGVAIGPTATAMSTAVSPPAPGADDPFDAPDPFEVSDPPDTPDTPDTPDELYGGGWYGDPTGASTVLRTATEPDAVGEADLAGNGAGSWPPAEAPALEVDAQDGAPGSFLIAGPGWDPADGGAPTVPAADALDLTLAHQPTDEQPAPGPARPRRGLGRVLPLTAGPDPSFPAEVVPVVGSPSGPTAFAPQSGDTTIARPGDPAATTRVAAVPPAADVRWGSTVAPSPYDSVTTELVTGHGGVGYDDLDDGFDDGADGFDGYGDEDDGYGPLSRRDRRSAQRIAEAEAKADRLVAKAEQRMHRRRRWPAVLIVMLLLAGAAGGSAYWYFLVRIPSHPVPSLVGRTDTEVAGLIDGYEWVVSKDYQFDDAAPAGQVLSQRPGPNVEVLRGGSLSLVISKGLPPVDVPTTVVGQTRDQAAATLTRAGLGLGAVETRFDEKVPADVVLALAPGTPAQVLKGTDVGLIVSSGPEPRTIPDGLVGKPADKAVAALEGLGLKPATSEEFSEAISKGNVISVDPGVGKQAPKGAAVAVVVSKGPPTVAVPKVDGQSVADATTALEDAGLKVSGLEGSPRKKVVGTDPAIGTTVRIGSSVKLITDPDAEPPDTKPTTTTTKPR